MKRGPFRSSAFIGAAALAGAIALTLTPFAGGASTYTDPAGDSGDGPDLTSIRISNDAAGELTFRLSVGNRPSGLNFREALVLLLNTDRNNATGSSGFDYRVSFAPSEYAVARWTGSRFEVFDPATDQAEIVAGGFVFRINRSDLGSTTGFEFGLGALAASQRVADTLPDAGLTTFVLVAYCKVRT